MARWKLQLTDTHTPLIGKHKYGLTLLANISDNNDNKFLNLS